MANVQDRRVRKTKQLFRQGLVQLMTEKKLNEITVREITDLTDMNRGTFYLHYKDVYDLLEQIESEMFTDFYEAINNSPHIEKPGKPLPIFLQAFQFIAKNADMSRVLLSTNGDIAFVDKLKNVVKSRSFEAWSTVYKDTNRSHYEYFHHFIVSGCIGIIQHWLDTGMQESTEEISVLAENMVLKGIQGILGKPVNPEAIKQ